MTYTRRWRWLLIVLGISILWPVKGQGVETDPYIYRSVIGRIFLEYERLDRNSEQTKDTTSRFQQRYSLDFQGNILSRNLMIYDAHVEYQRESTTDTTGNKTKANNIEYDLRTTLLPRSRIPLTLYGSRSTSELGLEDGQTNTTNTGYGMSWTGNFLTLPKIGVSTDINEQDTGGINSRTSDFRLDMSKNLGPTTNLLSYDFNKNSIEGTDSFNSSTLTFGNNTKFSRYTRTNFNATRSTQGSAGDTFDAYGLSADLSSSPSTSFHHNYGYSYGKTILEDTKTEAHSFFSSMDYRISEKTTSSASVSVIDDNTFSSSETTDTTTIGANGDIRHNFTRDIYAAQSISYSQSKTSTASSSESNLSNLTTLKTDTSVGYSRKMRWFYLSSSYGVGYTQQQDSIQGLGKGIQQTVTLRLRQIDFNRYFLFNASGEESRSKTLEGNFFDNSSRYSITTENKAWLKYVNLRGGYYRDSKDSWIGSLSEKNESIKFSARSKPFRNSRVVADYEYSKSSSEEVTPHTTSTVDLSASHNRVFYGGRLGLSLNFSLSRNDSEDTSFTTSITQYQLQYDRALLRRVLWRLRVIRTDTTTDDTFTNNTNIANSLFYKLRAWSISFLHEYSIENSSDRDFTESRIFVKVGRTFVRIF